MLLRYPAALFVLSATFATQASADAALAARYACVACHQPAKKLVGPSWVDIANRYADGSKSADQLAQSIRKGGSGIWGTMPMPAQPLNETDAKTLATWVLGQRTK